MSEPTELARKREVSDAQVQAARIAYEHSFQGDSFTIIDDALMWRILEAALNAEVRE